jgi:hypothetical protein
MVFSLLLFFWLAASVVLMRDMPFLLYGYHPVAFAQQNFSRALRLCKARSGSLWLSSCLRPSKQ